MDRSKNNIKNITILSLILAATIILICSWEPLADKSSLLQRHSSRLQPFARNDELRTALGKASTPDKTVVISVINKAYVEPPPTGEAPSMFDLFLEGFWAGEGTRPLVEHLLIVAVDDTAHERCLFLRLNCYRLRAADDASGSGDGDVDFAGEKVYMTNEFIEMMWRRTRFLLDVLRRGYDFIFTDTDVLWLRNPFTRLSMNQTLDLQISTDYFNGNTTSEKNPINTGFYFIRSNKKTITLFQRWYDMRRNSTGLKEQDVLQNMIRDKGVVGELGLNVRFLDTQYFSGFCKDSRDVGVVATVHANCCRSIRAKVADLKRALRDWKRFKNLGFGGSTNVQYSCANQKLSRSPAQRKKMATVRNLKIKTSTCKRIVKELHSYEKEVEREAAKTADMKAKGADPYDLKQQENVLAESRMMVPDCRKRLEAALSDLKGTVAELEESGQKEGPEFDDARSIIAEVEQLFQSSEL
ncbi:hypothetical protein Salat_2715700 [Sesamum alatum]|uniref:Nucleotide-diphospho-sugar transferase domain-containing protein n=1 Tax=Sesamum alatum TaxID=300844 RepID=A0AAE1XR92_9LAMI|nr:hypothetical protein Salat_2715700 [Sesamum alatum]